MVQSVAGGEGSVLSRDPSSVSDWWAPSWCCNCNIFPCSCYDINDSTFTQCRARISHRPGPGGSTGPPVVLHKVWFVCQDRQGSRAGELSDCQSHVFGKQSVLCLHLSTHHTVQTSVVPQPHPAGLGLVRHRDFRPLYSALSLSPPPPRLVLHLSNILKFTS